MKSPELRQHLATYADGELTPALRDEVAAAVAGDPDVQAEVERWQALRRCAQRALHSEATPAGLAERVCAGLSGETRPVSGGPRMRVYRFGLAGLSTAAIVILGFVLWPRGAVATPVDIDGFARIYRNCAVEHLHDAFQVAGSDVRSASAKIAAATGLVCKLPDLSACGNYRLAGACECSPDHKTRAIHAFYRSADAPEAVISVFEVERPVALTTSGTPCEHCKCGRRGYCGGCDKGVSMVCWRQANQTYVVAGRANERELVRLADEVQP